MLKGTQPLHKCEKRHVPVVFHPCGCVAPTGAGIGGSPAANAAAHRQKAAGCVDTFHGGVHEENGGHAAPSTIGVASTPIVPAGAASRSVNGSSASSAAPAASIFWKEGGDVPSDRERATPVEKCFVRYEGNFQDMSKVERCLIIFSTYPN